MTWQQGTTSATNPRRDLTAKIVQVATSKYAATVAVNAGGTGYVVGDVLTLTHASAVLDASFAVTSVSGGPPGPITGLRMRNGGAFGRRVATVAVNVGGSNYNAGDVVEIDESHAAGTDFQQRCKITVDTVTGGPPGPAATISILEGGGNYDGGTDPAATAATTTLIGPSTGTGTGLTVNTTMQALISTLTNLSVTGGTGSSATVDITLGGPGWQADVDLHSFSHNSVDDEKEVILTGTVAGGDAPVIGFRTFTRKPATVTHEGILLTGMETVNPALGFESQQGLNGFSDVVGTQGSYVSIFEDVATEYWFSVTDRKVMGAIFNDGVSKDVYPSFYSGLGSPFGTATETPYPICHLGTSSSADIVPDAGGIDQSGIVEQFRHSSRTGPFFYRNPTTQVWDQFYSGSGTSFPTLAYRSRGCFPLFEPEDPGQSTQENIVADGNFTFFDSVGMNTGAAATIEMRPAPGSNDRFALFPVVLVRETEDDLHLELEGVYWLSATDETGTRLNPRDTVTDVNGDVYVVFPQGDRSEQYSFFAMKEGA